MCTFKCACVSTLKCLNSYVHAPGAGHTAGPGPPGGGGGDIQRSEIEFEYFRNNWSLNQKELLGVNPGNQVGSWIYLMKKTRSQKYHDTVPIRGKHVNVCWYTCIFVSASYREPPAYATKPDTGTEYTGNFRVNLHGHFWSWFLHVSNLNGAKTMCFCTDYDFSNWPFRILSVLVQFHSATSQYV